ncbi:MAG: TAXI family TRAP transporter solute-binding subunit [Cardiobacteriaceae bacterium]|nr:TAXI family TRAP transporter solute-binding subunit [Cardiobacteriaceae bacterium]
MFKRTYLKTLIAASILTAGIAHAAVESSLISQPPGNSWYTYATTFNTLVPEKTDNAYKLKVVPRGGGMTNPVVVSEGKADFGFATLNAIVWARDGVSEAYAGKKNENIRLVADGLQEAYTIVIARKAWVDATGNDTLEKVIKADKVIIATKPTGSQVPIIADFLFREFGTDFETMKKQGKVLQISSGQASQMLRDNNIDVYIDNVPAMHPNLTEITLTNDVVYIPFAPETLDAMTRLGLPAGVMPANTYKGQGEDYRNPVSATSFIVGANVDDDTVYHVTKALVEGQAQLKEAHPPLAAWKPEAIGDSAKLFELHPGAAKYFRERGWIE